ncbi:MAG TPA: nucleotidyltransferase family protein, partial [Casimicrobiaceae bacterium]|nr:nucleotidyltransferase family protein [Casimicrobiaceae bacterium]
MMSLLQKRKLRGHCTAAKISSQPQAPSGFDIALRIAGILLAAGRGARFHGDKLRVRLPHASYGAPAGTPLGVAAAMHLVAALPESIAVVREAATALSAALAAAGLRIIECANADDGMGASLACGVAAVADADGCVVALADMPWISPATIRAVATALSEGAPIVAPVYGGQRGHPVGFSRRHFAALSTLHGDEGARSLLAHGNAITLIDCDDEGITRDVDTQDDLDDRVSARELERSRSADRNRLK